MTVRKSGRAHKPSVVLSSSESVQSESRDPTPQPRGSRQTRTSGPSRSDSSKNVFTEPPIVEGKRGTRAKRPIVDVSNSELSEEDEEDAEGELDDELDADGDLDMSDVATPPATRAAPKPAQKSKLATTTMYDDDDVDDDDDLSSLGSGLTDMDAEGEEDDEGGEEEDEEEEEEEEEDAPGAEDDEIEEEEPMEDIENDSDEEDADGEVTDHTRLTKRQRMRYETGPEEFLELPAERQTTKKELSAAEVALRRAEMARRRKNLSEKRNEEEKMDTINRLLNKQPSKLRGRAAALAAQNSEGGTPMDSSDGSKELPIKATMVRWTSTKDGERIGVPSEWEEAPAGALFKPNGLVLGGRGRKVVEEVV